VRQYVVQRVVDGDTVVLDMDGIRQTVRLIGIDTPEIVDPTRLPQCFGEEARAAAKVLLEGKTVSFETDPSQGAYDKYHRQLGYIELPGGEMYESYMLLHGFAREYTYQGHAYKHQKEFTADEVLAKSSKIGLWGACPQ
jgi:micrococcal nuclease